MRLIALAAALLLAVPAQAEEDFWSQDPDITDAVWQNTNTLNEFFWINQSEMEANGNYVTFWMHGHHVRNPKVRYRTSMWKMTLLCHGSLTLHAFSTFDAKGQAIDEIDYPGSRSTAVRPGTIYADIAEKFCPKRR